MPSIEPLIRDTTASDQTRVVAVVVAYRPDFKRLHRVLEATAPQVARIVVVNNGPPAAMGADLPQGIRVLEMGANRGLGAGLNAGIDVARAQGATHVLLLDQDSVPAPDMVSRLLRGLAVSAEWRPRIAAAGPLFVDAESGHPGFFVRLGWLVLRRIRCEADELVPCDFLISSGSLIPVPVLETVGPMDDSLFIEHLDTEWHLRARANGFQALGVCGARMTHVRGEDRVRLLGLDLPRHVPLRHYYLFRNSLRLYRRSYAPGRWILSDLLRNLAWLTLIPITHGTPLAHLKAIARGIRDGLRPAPRGRG